MALTPEQARKKLEHHLRYELWMLVETLNRPGPVDDDVYNNAFIESFCVHARNLIEFFKESRDYTTEGYRPFDGNRNPLPKDIVRRLNNQISHLIHDERTDIDAEKISGAERTATARTINVELAEFWRHLRPEFSALGRPNLTYLTARFTGPSAAPQLTTTSVSGMVMTAGWTK